MKVIYFAWVKDPRLFELLEFYREDISILGKIGFHVQTESRLTAAMRAEGDVLYAWWGASALPALIFWRLRRKRSILAGAVAFQDDGPDALRRSVKKALALLAAIVANENLAVSEYDLLDLRRGGVRRVRLAYPSVEVDFYQPGTKVAPARAVTVGQLKRTGIARKGIDVSVAAVPLVRKVVPDFELDVVGPFSEDGREWLEEEGRKRDLTGVRVHGQVSREEKLSLLQSASLYLQPSRHEAFGVAVVEAMACGTVPVHSGAGALSEVVGESGVVLGERTAECLAENIVTLIKDGTRRSELERRARVRAEDFGRSRREKVLASVMDDLLGGSGRPPMAGQPRRR